MAVEADITCTCQCSSDLERNPRSYLGWQTGVISALLVMRIAADVDGDSSLEKHWWKRVNSDGASHGLENTAGNKQHARALPDRMPIRLVNHAGLLAPFMHGGSFKMVLYSHIDKDRPMKCENNVFADA